MARDLGLDKLAEGINRAVLRLSGAMEPVNVGNLQDARLKRVQGDTQQKILDIFGDPESDVDARLRGFGLQGKKVQGKDALTQAAYESLLANELAKTESRRQGRDPLTTVYDPTSDSLIKVPASEARGKRTKLPPSFDITKDLEAVRNLVAPSFEETSGIFGTDPSEITDDATQSIMRMANNLVRYKGMSQDEAIPAAVEMLQKGEAIEDPSGFAEVGVNPEKLEAIMQTIASGLKEGAKPKAKKPLAAFGG